MPAGGGGPGTPRRHVGRSGARSAPGTPRAGQPRDPPPQPPPEPALPPAMGMGNANSTVGGSAGSGGPSAAATTASIFDELERYLQEQEVEAKKAADVNVLQGVLHKVLRTVKELAEEVHTGVAKNAQEHQKATALLQKAKQENEALRKRASTIEQFFEKKVEQYNHLLQEERRAVKEMKAKNDHLTQLVESYQHASQGGGGKEDEISVLARQLKYEREQRLACEEQGSKMQAEQGKTISNLEHRIKLLTQQAQGANHRRSVSPNNPRFGGRTSSTSGMSGFSGNSNASTNPPPPPANPAAAAAHAAAMGQSVGTNLPANMNSALSAAAAAAFAHLHPGGGGGAGPSASGNGNSGTGNAAPPAASNQSGTASTAAQAARAEVINSVPGLTSHDLEMALPPPVLDGKLLSSMGLGYPGTGGAPGPAGRGHLPPPSPSSRGKTVSASGMSAQSGCGASTAGSSVGGGGGGGGPTAATSPPPVYPLLPTPLPEYRRPQGGANAAAATATATSSSMSGSTPMGVTAHLAAAGGMGLGDLSGGTGGPLTGLGKEAPCPSTGEVPRTADADALPLPIPATTFASGGGVAAGGGGGHAGAGAGAGGAGGGPVPKGVLRSISPPQEPPTPLLPISPPAMLSGRYEEMSPPQAFAFRVDATPATGAPRGATGAAPPSGDRATPFAARTTPNPPTGGTRGGGDDTVGALPNSRPPPPRRGGPSGLDMLERKMQSGGTIDSIDELSSVLEALETTVLKP